MAFRDILSEKVPTLIDGGLGTELYARGVFINRCFEEANLINPSLVTEIHRDYLAAGAQIITTNSWGANGPRLAEYNLQDRLTDINREAVRIARGAAETAGAWVSGSVGPLGIRLEPYGPTSHEEARQAFSQQITALAEGGCDLISLETFSNLAELEQALIAARESAPNLPVSAFITIASEGTLPMGTPADHALHQVASWQPDVLGINCSVGPQPMFTLLEKVIDSLELPIAVCPNAGLPKLVDGRLIYMSTPEYMAEFTKRFFELGVQFVGGCCGTTPEHIKAMANALRHAKVSSPSRFKPAIITTTDTSGAAAAVPCEQKSRWARKIASGERVFSIELLPPAGIDPEQILSRSRKIKQYNIDAINIPDGPRASARMSALVTAILIEQQVGIETVLHYTCRDRNLLGMQSDLLGAAAVGLRNLLLVTGDPPKLGSYPDATGVFDIDAIGLTNMVTSLNRGIDLGGRKVGKLPALSVGVGVNPVHHDFPYEMKRFAWKVDAGAEWAISQPIFDIEALLRFLDYINTNNLKIPIVAGIWPLQSYRNALFMNNEVPGVVIPEATMEKMRKHQDNPEDARKVGVDIATEMIVALKSVVQGFQISAPFGRVDLVLGMLDAGQ